MKSFEQLYKELLEAVNENNEDKYVNTLDEYDVKQLDCLLHPEKHPLVWRSGECKCEGGEHHCVSICPFHAIHPNEEGELKVDEELCSGCAYCIQECRAHKLTNSKDIIPVLRALRSHEGLTYALVAPAFLGQFTPDVTPGMLRSALKQVGFDGMIEVALFADILTLKEALEFDENIVSESDYQLTSCCCPVWIALIKKIYKELVPHVPPAVSPMIASGRAIKALYPDALTVFIGPCLAKKAEAKEKDLVGAVDYVLTFQEVQDIFRLMNIDPSQMEESEKDHSSRAGRIYAHTGGVSEAVELTLNRINPNRDIKIKTRQADGVPACKALIKDILDGNINGNFFEGMGCVGGCVGGPKAIIPKEEGRENVVAYGKSASYPTPIDNPYVIELLHQLGIDTVEELVEKSDIFTRTF